MRRRLGMLALAAAATGHAIAESAAYRLTTVAEDLAHPWCVAFLPGGDMLVTERGGTLRMVRDGVLQALPVAGVPPVYARSQGGLFDVLLHPNFADNRLIYLSYAHGTPQRNATRLARGRLEGNQVTDLEVVFTVEPWKATPVHYGGRVAFLPDGTLLVTTGDGFVHREDAQRLDNLLGKIVRLNDDGSIPADNPFVDDPAARDEIWSYGHRNPQGVVVAKSASGAAAVFIHEHGPRGGDELNLVEPGRNYGWPVATFGVDYTGALISPFTEYRGMEPPLVDWTPSIAPAGLAWYDGEAFPEWRGDLFATSLVFQYVERIDLDDGEVAGRERLFDEIGERLRDVRVGPDGRLYILTDSNAGRLIRVDPAS